MPNPKLTAIRAAQDTVHGVLVEVPPDVTTIEQLRAFDVAMHRKHGEFRRRTYPLEQNRRALAAAQNADPPFLELPPEFADAERRILARDPTFGEAEYQRVLAALHAFDDVAYIRHGRQFTRRKTLMDRPDPQPPGPRKLMARLSPSGAVVGETVTRGLLMSSCRICVPVAGTRGAFPTREACEAVCGQTVTVDCCTDPLPAILTLTVSGAGDYAMMWDGNGWATGLVTVPECGTISIRLFCTGLDVSGFRYGNVPGADCVVAFDELGYVNSCAPFSVSAPGVIGGAGCGCSSSRTFTVTA